MQYKVFKGKVSETSTITCNLGPLFFILFINDLPLHIENSYYDMYAGDSSVTSTATTIKDLETNLNEDMTWQIHDMLSNGSKTKAMLIIIYQKCASLPEEDRVLKVTLNDTHLDNVENDKLLGAHKKNYVS